jgi:hypothetical protein
MVPEWGTLKSQQKAAVKGGRRPAKRTLEGCVLSHPRHLTMGLAGRPPKTEAGRRTVSIPPQIMARLERHLRSFVGADGSLPVLTGRKGGRLGRHPSTPPGRQRVDSWVVPKSTFTTCGVPA